MLARARAIGVFCAASGLARSATVMTGTPAFLSVALPAVKLPCGKRKAETGKSMSG